MCHSHVRSLHPDINGLLDEAKNEMMLGHNKTSHATYRHSTPDLENESDSEQRPAHATSDVHPAAQNHVLSGDEPILTGLDRTGPRVRFRSRVRISAGIGRRGRGRSDGPPSNASSISGSPSSSISVPLRTHYTGENGWGTLGSRVKFSAWQSSPVSPCQDDDVDGGKGSFVWDGDGGARTRHGRSSWTVLDDDADEYTHLLTSATRHSYSYVGRYSCDDRERELERRLREQLVDEAFGKWPGRLLNQHWWWWHIEPVLCCLCGPDEDE